MRGGAWSPIGDVTTTMLWIGGQITSANIMVHVIIPSLMCLIVPLIFLSFTVKGKIDPVDVIDIDQKDKTSSFERNLILGLGIGALIFVPVF